MIVVAVLILVVMGSSFLAGVYLLPAAVESTVNFMSDVIEGVKEEWEE